MTELTKLLYSIGEAVFCELDAVKEVRYPSGENPTELYIELADGRLFTLTLNQNSAKMFTFPKK